MYEEVQWRVTITVIRVINALQKYGLNSLAKISHKGLNICCNLLDYYLHCLEH